LITACQSADNSINRDNKAIFLILEQKMVYIQIIKKISCHHAICGRACVLAHIAEKKQQDETYRDSRDARLGHGELCPSFGNQFAIRNRSLAFKNRLT
jgi:hypothetical protein